MHSNLLLLLLSLKASGDHLFELKDLKYINNALSKNKINLGSRGKKNKKLGHS